MDLARIVTFRHFEALRRQKRQRKMKDLTPEDFEILLQIAQYYGYEGTRENFLNFILDNHN